MNKEKTVFTQLLQHASRYESTRYEAVRYEAV